MGGATPAITGVTGADVVIVEMEGAIGTTVEVGGAVVALDTTSVVVR